jgi:carbamoyltransferase
VAEKVRILGISAFYHDSAAALVADGDIVAAAQEERFTRKKHDFDFPRHAARYCLAEAGVAAGDLDAVVFYDKPILKFERILETYIAYAPRGIRSFFTSMPLWLREKLFVPSIIRKELGYEGEILFAEHHESHAASAFYPSPFREAAIVTLDGVGEWTTTSWGLGRDNRIELREEIRFPHSLGLLYSAFTYFTGFKVNSGEYKLMGLAPYGEPRYVDLILRELVDLKDDGSFRLNMKYFDYGAGLRMTNKRFADLFGGPPRAGEAEITQREMDMARSIQQVTEEIMLRIARHVHRETGMKRLCLAGGVALNCVGNGRILREGPFEDLWIQPAAGDAGGALGAALLVWHERYDKPRVPRGGRDSQRASYLGPAFPDEVIESYLKENGFAYERLGGGEIGERVAVLCESGAVVGWFQGRMEFGPRALGSRSIVGDARSPAMQKIMNLKIKYRESFRPFAPTVLEDRVSEYFDLDRESPYMLLTARVRRDKCVDCGPETERAQGLGKLDVVRSEIPAVTHVDYSARVQTVRREDNPGYYDMIEAFRRRTGCAVVINTSFNVRGEPIVCTPHDAYRCFMRTEMDYLVMGPFLLDKALQPKLEETADWRAEFALD